MITQIDPGETANPAGGHAVSAIGPIRKQPARRPAAAVWRQRVERCSPRFGDGRVGPGRHRPSERRVEAGLSPSSSRKVVDDEREDPDPDPHRPADQTRQAAWSVNNGIDADRPTFVSTQMRWLSTPRRCVTHREPVGVAPSSTREELDPINRKNTVVARTIDWRPSSLSWCSPAHRSATPALDDPALQPAPARRRRRSAD